MILDSNIRDIQHNFAHDLHASGFDVHCDIVKNIWRNGHERIEMRVVSRKDGSYCTMHGNSVYDCIGKYKRQIRSHLEFQI